MCIYLIKTPMKRGNVGKMWTTLAQAKRAAARAAKRYGHANIHHWKTGKLLTVFSDGTEEKSHDTIS